MPHPCPHHCPSGSGGGALAVLVVLAVVIAAATRPVVHAAELVLEVVLITISAIAGITAITAVGYSAIRVRRWRASKPRAIPAPARAAQAISAPQPAAIEAPKQRLDGDQMRNVVTDYENR